MTNIKIRVAARGRSTAPVRFNANKQQVRLTASPALAGRSVTLQRRAGHRGGAPGGSRSTPAAWTAAAARASDNRTQAEVVPQRYSRYECGARSIVLADITPHRNQVRFGATSPRGNRRWTGVRKGVRILQTPNAYAVEVGRRHVTWFVNGRPVGTVRSKAVVPGVPLTLRISMVGDGAREMDHTYAIMDWIRGYQLDRGRQVRSGKALKKGRHGISC